MSIFSPSTSLRRSANHGTISLLIILLCLTVAPINNVCADQVISQRLVSTTESDGSTLGWPRWKGYMSHTDPDRIWISYAGASGSAPSLNYTTDAGATWNSNVIQISFDGWLDEHLSCAGTDDELYFTFPGSNGTMFRRFDYPAQSENDRGPLVELANTTNQHRSNVMVEPSGRIWVFTRRSGSASENVRYQYSDNGGSTWTTGVAYATNHDNVRFGSMQYIDGRPALVVLYLDDARGYEYYLWNGSSFEARPDHSIFAQNMGQVRAFSHNVVNDTIFHLVFGLDDGLHHAWKAYNNGTGSWNHNVIETSTTTSDVEWSPITTVRGGELYVFYVEKTTTALSSSQIFYKRWLQSSQSWTAPVRVSDPAISSSNVHPNSVFQVPATSNTIPVFWSAGGGTYDIYFGSISVDPYSGGDQTAPARITNLTATVGNQDGEIRLSWTAPGDDGSAGTAARYVLKYSTSPITGLNWAGVTTYPNPPTPLPGGQVQTFMLTGLTPGTPYYTAIVAFDEADNAGAVSNSPQSFAFGILIPTPLESVFDFSNSSLELTCQTVSSYHTLIYQFALDSLISFPEPSLKQASSNGAEAIVQYVNVDSGFVYYWRCRAIAADLSDTSSWSIHAQTNTTDCCQGTRGNVNCDVQGDINLTDLTKLVGILFTTFETPCCSESADTNGDNKLSLTDLTILVNHLFVTFEPILICP